MARKRVLCGRALFRHKRGMPPDYFPPPLPPPPLPPPRVWPALTVPLIAIVGALLLGGIVEVGMMVADKDFQTAIKPMFVPPTPAPGQAPDKAKHSAVVPIPKPDFGALARQSMEKLLVHPYGVAVLLVPGQFVLAAVTFSAAALSRRRMRDRLGYVRSALPWWTLPILMIATIFCGMLGGIIVDLLFPGPHDAMEFFAEMAHSGSGAVAVLNTALISLVPGFVEESLFRGYVQRRLLERWTPLAAVAVSSVFFCAAHFDPQHVIGVVPVGFWLGVIAWRSGAVWPGMLCHATMNAVSFALMRFGPDSDDRAIPPGMWVALAVGAAAVGLAIFFMRRYPPGRLATAPAPA